MKNLINLSGGDQLNLRVEGKILISESIKNGKTRQTQKEFASIDEAQKACAKKGVGEPKKGLRHAKRGCEAWRNEPARLHRRRIHGRAGVCEL